MTLSLLSQKQWKKKDWHKDMTEMLKGIAASDGVAVAKAYLLVQPDLSFETITVEDTNAEEARLDVALEASQNELSLIREKAVGTLGEEAAQVFDAHLMVLADPELIGQIKETIRAKKVNAEAGLKEVTDMFITIFEGMEDNPYMQERAADIRDVTKRVLANLLGKKLPNPASINEEVIVIAHDLTPSDTAQLDKNFVKAFVTNIGGRTSHSAIMARTLEIAAVLGTNNITELVKDGDILAVSGISGEVVINPTEEQIAELKKRLEERKSAWEQANQDEQIAMKTVNELVDESTAELEESIANIDSTNAKVRDNLNKQRAQEEADEYKRQYGDLTTQIEDIRKARMELLNGVEMPLDELSVQDGELIYKGQKWDNMSGSDQLKVATAIVRKTNPQCGFVLLDKLEQMDIDTMNEFGKWLQDNNLQAIATRVSTGDECSIFIEDGYSVDKEGNKTADTFEKPAEANKKEWF